MYKKSAHKIWVKLTPRTCIVAIIPSFFWRQHFFLKWWQILLCRHVCGNFCQNVGHRCCRQLLNDSYLEKDRRTVYKNRFDMKYFRIQWLIIIAKNLFFGSFRTRVHGSNPTWSDILVTKTKTNLTLLLRQQRVSVETRFDRESDSQPGSSEHLVSISSTFKAQLFRAQIPKV